MNKGRPVPFPSPRRIGALRVFFDTIRRPRRRFALATIRFLRLSVWGELARIYTFILMVPVIFSGFWIVAVFYVQLGDPKQETIKVFPNGLNDATALIPLALAGFAALLFNAQQSVPPTSQRHRDYGVAGRRVLLAFFYLATTFVLGVGSRIVQEGTFDGWRLAWILNGLAKNLQGVLYINAAIAFTALLSGLWYYIRTIKSSS